jgi:MFS family permease
MRRPSLGDDYRRLWIAAAVSNLGDGVFFASLPLLAVTVTRDPLALAVIVAALTAPWLLFALPSGVTVDRRERITLMWRVDVSRAVLTVGLFVIVATGRLSIPSLALVAFGLGTAATLFDTASLAAVPAVVGTDSQQLTRANAGLESANIVANRFLGPPLGTALFAVMAVIPIVVNSASFLCSALCLAGITKRPQPPTSASVSWRIEIAVGLRWLRSQRLLHTFAIVVGLMNLSFAAIDALLVLLIEDTAGAGPVGYAAVLTVGAAGALIGSLAAEPLSRRLPPNRLLPGTVTAFAAAMLIMGLLPRAVFIAAGFAVAGFAASVWNVVTVAIRQQLTPEHLLGRVNSIYRLIAYGAIPLGALAGGALAQMTSVTIPFVLAATITMAALPRLHRSVAHRPGTDCRRSVG